MSLPSLLCCSRLSARILPRSCMFFDAIETKMTQSWLRSPRALKNLQNLTQRSSHVFLSSLRSVACDVFCVISGHTIFTLFQIQREQRASVGSFRNYADRVNPEGPGHTKPTQPPK